MPSFNLSTDWMGPITIPIGSVVSNPSKFHVRIAESADDGDGAILEPGESRLAATAFTVFARIAGVFTAAKVTLLVDGGLGDSLPPFKPLQLISGAPASNFDISPNWAGPFVVPAGRLLTNRSRFHVRISEDASDANGSILSPGESRLSETGVSIFARVIANGGLSKGSLTLDPAAGGTLAPYQQLNLDGDGPAPGVAPVITRQPRITPTSAAVNDSVTIDLGAATGADGPPTYRVMLGATNVTDQVSGDPLALELTDEGNLTVSDVTYSNAYGSVTADPVTITVEAAPSPVEIEYSRSVYYFDKDSGIGGSTAAVTSVTGVGLVGGAAVATGTGNAAEMTTGAQGGLKLAAGIYFQTAPFTTTPQQMGDGVFAVIDVTIDSVSGSNAEFLSGAGSRVAFMDAAGTIRAAAAGTPALNKNIGATLYGTRMIMAARIDDVADLFETINPTGVTTTDALAVTDPVMTRIGFGRYLNGTIHRLAIFGRPEGGAWPYTMEQIYEDFQ